MRLFTNGRNVDTLTLGEIGDVITGEVPQLGLPKFQRDAVWDAERVELLWDSMLRGFPFGAFIVARVTGAIKDHIKPLSGSTWGQLTRYTEADNATTAVGNALHSDAPFLLME